MLDIDRQRPWSEEEIARVISTPGDVRHILRRLRAAKLIHRWNDLAVAPHAAVRFHEIWTIRDSSPPPHRAARMTRRSSHLFLLTRSLEPRRWPVH